MKTYDPTINFLIGMSTLTSVISDRMERQNRQMGWPSQDGQRTEI